MSALQIDSKEFVWTRMCPKNNWQSAQAFRWDRRFESKGEISLKSLVRLAISLNRAQDFDLLFQIEEEIDLFKPESKPRQRASRGTK